jgi:hypothetical protein
MSEMNLLRVDMKCKQEIIVFVEALVCIFCVNPTFLSVIPLYQCSLGVFPPS